MSQSFVRWVSRLLIVCMAALPFQLQAGMIGTSAVASAAEARVARDALRALVERASAQGRLQAWGLTQRQAEDRIAALTDQEAADLAARADRAPAGADGAGIGLLIVLLFLLWKFVLEPAWNPETKKGNGKK